MFPFISESPRVSANINMSTAVSIVIIWNKCDSQMAESVSMLYLQATYKRSPAILSKI